MESDKLNLCFREVVASVATDLENLVGALRGALVAEGSDDKKFTQLATFLSAKSYPKMNPPKGSRPFRPSVPRTPGLGKADALLCIPQTIQTPPPGECLEESLLPFSLSDSHLPESEGEDSPEENFKMSSMTCSQGSHTQAPLREAWASEAGEQMVNDYLDELKQKPVLASRPSSILNLFFSDFQWRQSASQNSFASNLWLAVLRLRWVISPLTRWRLVWDVLSILFLLYDVLLVPLQVFDIPDSIYIQVVEVFCCIFWAADVIMSFRTGFSDGHILEMRATRVATHYLKTWFLYDLIALIVHGLHMLREGVIVETMQVARLGRLYKLVRFRRIVIERSNSNRMHLYLDCLDIAVWCAIAMHLISCGWYWLGERASGWTREDHMQGADLLYSYFTAARWTIAQVSGRTDLELRTASEYIYTCCACVFGLIIMSLMISSITNTMIELGALNRDRSSKARAFNAFLKRNHVVGSLALRAKAALAMQQKILLGSEKEQEVISLLPRQIMVDLLFEIRGPLLMQHVLFADLGREFPRMVRRLCADVVKMVFVGQEELAFAVGDACTRMLFVSSGSVQYTWKEKKRHDMREAFSVSVTARKSDASSRGEGKSGDAHILRQKQWLSEAALWVEWEHRGDLKGCELSSLTALEVQEFTNVVKLFRFARARSVLYARAFVQALYSLDKWSDVMEPIHSYIYLEDHEVVTQTPAQFVNELMPVDLAAF